MENAFLLVLSGFLRSVMWQIVMFLLCGIAFELLLEFIKATLFPKDEKGESRSCPRWLGLVMGAVITAAYLALAYMAFFAFGAEGGFLIPGGLIFIPVWAILFFFYQYKALRLAKWLCSKMFPTLKDPFYKKPEKKHRERYTEEQVREALEYLGKRKAEEEGTASGKAEASTAAGK